MLRDFKIRMPGLLQEMLVEELDPAMFQSQQVCCVLKTFATAAVALRLLVGRPLLFLSCVLQSTPHLPAAAVGRFLLTGARKPVGRCSVNFLACSQLWLTY